MTPLSFRFCEQSFSAYAAGALWWPEQRLLCVSDLHLGKALRFARRGGATLPPYEVMETLSRLEAVIAHANPRMVLCLGDSFDCADDSATLDEGAKARLLTLQAGRTWIWIEGNHDPGPVDLPGDHLADLEVAGIWFRHIHSQSDAAEISGHYHPKLRLRAGLPARAVFLHSARQMIMPAFGAYTGGMDIRKPPLATLITGQPHAILTGDLLRQVILPPAESGRR